MEWNQVNKDFFTNDLDIDEDRNAESSVELDDVASVGGEQFEEEDFMIENLFETRQEHHNTKNRSEILRFKYPLLDGQQVHTN